MKLLLKRRLLSMPAQRKKMLIIAVLETLRKYTDEHHRLMQAPLLALLEKDYGLQVDRKSLRHNIEDLINAGYPLRYQRGWYYDHELTREDMSILARSLSENISLPAEAICRILKKISRVVPICQEPLLTGTESEKLKLLEKAITENKSVSFEASGTRYSDMVPLEIEREGRIVMRSAAAAGKEESPSAERWLVTVQEKDTLKSRTFPLFSVTDLSISG